MWCEAPNFLLNFVSQLPPSFDLVPPENSIPTEADIQLVEEALAEYLDSVRRAAEGGRNVALNLAAYNSGKLVGAKVVEEDRVVDCLLTAAGDVGLGMDEARRTIRSGLGGGKLRPWFPKAADRLLHEINAHAFLSYEGRSAFVYREERDPISGNRILACLRIEAFKQQYSNKLVPITKGAKTAWVRAGQAWLDWSGRREFQRIIFAPGVILAGSSYNLWQGFAVDAISGNCEKFLLFIRDIICGGDEALFQYVIAWCASAVQKPSAPGETTIVLRGKKGVGKTFFVDRFGELFGEHYAILTSSRHLTGHFNAHLETAIIVLADEAYWAGDKQGEGTLKALITSRTIRVEKKFVDSKSVLNHVHLLMASNSEWVVPAGVDERRYVVLDVSDARKEDYTYFADLEHEWRNGGREAFMFHLQHLDFSGTNLRKAPKTEALLEQKLHGLKPIDRWFLRMLEDGGNIQFVPGATWAEWVSTKDLYKDCAEFCKERRIPVPSDEALGMRLNQLLPCEPGRATQRVQRSAGSKSRTWGYQFPPLDVCRKHFEKLLGFEREWDTSDLPPAPEPGP